MSFEKCLGRPPKSAQRQDKSLEQIEEIGSLESLLEKKEPILMIR
jgi:hypothetical protein